MPASNYAERIAERSRAITIAALLLLSLLAWAYLLSGAGIEPMSAMHGTGLGWTLAAAMWIAMMVAMMLPSAAPAIMLYARVHRHSFGNEGLRSKLPDFVRRSRALIHRTIPKHSLGLAARTA